jgi:hypothetical protein
MKDLTEAMEQLMDRVRRDRPSRDQFLPLDSPGALCETPIEECLIDATWRRPPMPEKGTKSPWYACDACWRRMPAAQS